MPMYVVSCTSPKPDGKEHVEAAFSYFQKNKYPPTVRYDEASLVSFIGCPQTPVKLAILTEI